MPNDKMLTFRADETTDSRLEKLAQATARSKSWHLQQAVEAYLNHQAWQIGEIKKGLEDLESGRLVDHESVGDWLKSWGTEDEKDAHK